MTADQRYRFRVRLAQRRVDLGLSQYKLGKLIGTKQNYIAAWECGASMLNLQHFCDLLAALSCTADFLLFGK